MMNTIQKPKEITKEIVLEKYEALVSGVKPVSRQAAAEVGHMIAIYLIGCHTESPKLLELEAELNVILNRHGYNNAGEIEIAKPEFEVSTLWNGPTYTISYKIPKAPLKPVAPVEERKLFLNMNIPAGALAGALSKC